MNILDKRFQFLLATTIGVIVANLYYSQPIISLIGQSLGIQPAAAGSIAMLTQFGYGLGVLFIVPLADLVENKKLILTVLGLAIVSAFGLGATTQASPYFFFALIVGVGASAVQILLPYVSHLASEKHRGKILGILMSGLMVGIMLSRPISSFLTDLFSWHAVFYFSSGLMIALGFILNKYLPERHPQASQLSYLKLISSMGKIYLHTPVLRRRALYQACLFGAFSVFWTATPLWLSGPDFNFSQSSIALFALAGVAGAVVAPFAGKIADRG